VNEYDLWVVIERLESVDRGEEVLAEKPVEKWVRADEKMWERDCSLYGGGREIQEALNLSAARY
jgi:hypothetical protein